MEPDDMPPKTDDVISRRHREGFEALDSYWDGLNAVRAELVTLHASASPKLREHVDELIERIDAFEPAVSVIGQIKAGKSSMLNALIGQTGLLPSDVNPWTSVITSVHLNSRHRPQGVRALFRFFDALEWDRLVTTGGRLGEMAKRVGHEQEAKAVRDQVMTMRQTTEARLGDSFESLLGSSHTFPTITKDVVDRYVCYGEADEGHLGEGAYADITKSADLYIDLPGYPTGLVLRDTPGVNDTFMMREQITLNAISESRVVVIVLSAHQALSTMDMALLRITCNVSSREVLIFVNRIDELPDPVAQTRQIEASIRKTLEKNHVARDVPILFGSAHWGLKALDDRCGELSPQSRAALTQWVATKLVEGEELSPVRLREMAFAASGVMELHRAIATRVVGGPGRALLADVKASQANIANEIEVVGSLAAQAQSALDADQTRELGQQAETIADAAMANMRGRVEQARADLRDRMGRAADQFVEASVESLTQHIRSYGRGVEWQCDPTMLRLLMRTGYLSTCKQVKVGLGQVLRDSAERFEDLLMRDIGLTDGSVTIELPQGPTPKPPVVIARTTSLDMQTSWWRRLMLFRQSPEEQARRYETTIRAEAGPIIESVFNEYFEPYCQECERTLSAFCGKQVDFVAAVLERMGEDLEDDDEDDGFLNTLPPEARAVAETPADDSDWTNVHPMPVRRGA